MPRPARRRVNGDGSLTKRADGRWMGRYYAWTSAGTRKRQSDRIGPGSADAAPGTIRKRRRDSRRPYWPCVV